MAKSESNPRLLVASVAGYVVAALFNSLLVILKETQEGVEDWLVNTFGHHWIGHGILVVLTFIIATGISYGAYKGGAEEKLYGKLLVAILGATIVSVAIIALFFLAE